MYDLSKRSAETDTEYHKRLVYGKLVDGTLSDYDYAELAPYVYGQDYSTDVARRMMYGSRKTLDILERDLVKQQDSKSATDSISDKILELQKERKKIQTEKIELDKMVREFARDELIFEKLHDAISLVPGMDFPPLLNHDAKEYKRTGVLVFGDEHYGAEFTIRGLHGEVINHYSPDVAELRMTDLLNQVIQIVSKEDLDEIHVLNMGDFTDGVLRVGQLKKLQLGVVDSTVRYMEFLSQWLNTLSRVVSVKFQMVHGNHSELRMLGQPKGTFKDENMGKIVASYIKMRLDGNPNFEFITNPSGLIYDDILGFKVLGIHGEVRNMERAIRDFSAMYNTDIDYLLAGHLHHAEGCSVGYRKAVIRVPSIVGTDEFAMSLNAVSDPGATFLVFEEGVGKRIEYTIYL